MQESGTADTDVEAGEGATARSTEVEGAATNYSVATDLQRAEGESSNRVADDGSLKDDTTEDAAVDTLDLPGPTYQIDDTSQSAPVA